MRILLIEDHEHKRQRIREFLETQFTDLSITEVASYNSARRAIAGAEWDLLLVDMSIPTFDKSKSEPPGQSRSLGGKQLIRRITKKGISAKFLIVTQFTTFSDDGRSISANQIDAEIKELGNDNYLGMVLFNTTKSEWKTELEKHINSINNDQNTVH